MTLSDPREVDATLFVLLSGDLGYASPLLRNVADMIVEWPDWLSVESDSVRNVSDPWGRFRVR